MEQTANTSSESGLDIASFSSVIRPQDNLFRFVNGPWLDTYTLPEDRPRSGSFDKLMENAESQVRDILDEEGNPARKSTVIYRSFLDTEAIEKAGLDPIRQDLSDIDAVDDKAGLTRILGSMEPTGGPDLFAFEIYGDEGDPKNDIIHIGQGGLGLPDEAYYREPRYEQIRQSYLSMVSRLLNLAGYADNREDADAQALRLLDTETRIAAFHWDNVATRDADKTYNPTDLDQLSGTLSHFDFGSWLDSMQEAFDRSPAQTENRIDIRRAFAHVIVGEPSFFTGLDAFWQSADLDDLKLWARVHLLINWSTYLPADFEQARFDFYGRTLTGTTKMRDRWKRAVSLVNEVSGEEIGREYVKRHFPESSKAKVEALVSNLIAAYRASITSSDWLGEDTKKKALDKLAKFKPMVGYTNKWRDYGTLYVSGDKGLVENMREANMFESRFSMAKAGNPVDREEWLMNPQTVNAYYEPTLNVIVFPAAILQPPFFDPEADDAVNYGGIGAVIGHEIGHGFDDQGSKFDGDGRLTDWWTEQDRTNFEARTTALISQYNRFVPQQLSEKYADDPSKAPHVNGALTIGENIGDLGGVDISLKAYAFAMQEAAGQDIDPTPDGIGRALNQAPRIDGYTGLQRFFLSYASIWREKVRDELAEQLLQIDPHSPAEFRTNGIVRNSDRFYEAFDVKPEDDMWMEPEDRVHIW